MSELRKLPGRLGLGLDPRVLLGNGASGEGDDVILYGGDRAVHAGPDADGEALVYGFADLLLVGDLVAFGDKRGSGLEEAAKLGLPIPPEVVKEADSVIGGAPKP